MPMLQWTRGGFGDTSFDLLGLPFNSNVMTDYAVTFDETIIGNYTAISQQSDPTFTNVAQQSAPTFTAISQQMTQVKQTSHNRVLQHLQLLLLQLQLTHLHIYRRYYGRQFIITKFN